MVPKRGLEPPRPNEHYDLNVARLPFRHFGKIKVNYLVRPRWWNGRHATLRW